MNTIDNEFDDSIWTGAAIGCASVEEVELPSGKSGFFAPVEGAQKLRFLQGPVISYVSQEWEDGKPVGDKKHYKHSDPAAKKDPNARLVMTYLIYSYTEKKTLLWEISQKSILEDLKNINGIQADLSAFDIQLTKSPRTGTKFFDYRIAQGTPKPFTDADAIAEVVEKPLGVRIQERNEKYDTVAEEQTSIEEQIEAAGTPAPKAPAPAPKAATKAPAPAPAPLTPADVEAEFE